MNERLVRNAAAVLAAQVVRQKEQASDVNTRNAELELISIQLNEAIAAPSDTPELDELKTEISNMMEAGSKAEQPTIAEG